MTIDCSSMTTALSRRVGIPREGAQMAIAADQPIRWGIVGTGGIAATFAGDLKLLPDAQVVAVGSRSQESADKFGARFDIPRRYATYEELAEDEDVDAVYVSTPHPMHHANALLAIRAGK